MRHTVQCSHLTLASDGCRRQRCAAPIVQTLFAYFHLTVYKKFIRCNSVSPLPLILSPTPSPGRCNYLSVSMLCVVLRIPERQRERPFPPKTCLHKKPTEKLNKRRRGYCGVWNGRRRRLPSCFLLHVQKCLLNLNHSSWFIARRIRTTIVLYFEFAFRYHFLTCSSDLVLGRVFVLVEAYARILCVLPSMIYYLCEWWIYNQTNRLFLHK